MAKKILIVDDDTNALQLAESILKSKGYDVVALNHPRYIFKVIKEERPNLVISDIIMPNKDGYAICAEIKQLYRDAIPVLLCTSQSYEQDLIATACKDFGAEDFIIKPFKADELLKKVEKITKQKEQ